MPSDALPAVIEDAIALCDPLGVKGLRTAVAACVAEARASERERCVVLTDEAVTREEAEADRLHASEEKGADRFYARHKANAACLRLHAIALRASADGAGAKP